MLVKELISHLEKIDSSTEVVLSISLDDDSLPPFYIRLYKEDLILNAPQRFLEISTDMSPEIEEELDALLCSNRSFAPDDILLVSRSEIIPQKTLQERMASHNMSIVR